MPKIFITSYPYVYERYFRVFDYFENKQDLFFILPTNWQVKKRGRYLTPPHRDDIKIITAKSYFWHSHYPIIGGLLKGWIPATGGILKKYAHPGDILFTANEPNHLSVLYNAFLAKKYGLKHVIYADQNVSYRQRLRGLKKIFVEWIIRKNVSMAEKIFYSNQKARGILLDYSPADKLVFAPEAGIDTEQFKPGLKSAWRSEYNLNDKIVFCFAGMLEARKGIMETLHAFQMVAEKVPQAVLVLIGFGPEKERAQKFVEENFLSSKVIFINFVDHGQLPYIFSAIDILVCYSLPFKGWEEQLGYSIREVLASGVPVISTKTGSIDEAVIEGKNGLLLMPGDEKALASAMISLAANPQIRMQMGEYARNYALTHFSHQIIAKILEKNLEENLDHIK